MTFSNTLYMKKYIFFQTQDNLLRDKLVYVSKYESWYIKLQSAYWVEHTFVVCNLITNIPQVNLRVMLKVFELPLSGYFWVNELVIYSELDVLVSGPLYCVWWAACTHAADVMFFKMFIQIYVLHLLNVTISIHVLY